MIETLRLALEGRGCVSRVEAKVAAVLVPLIDDGAPRVLLTRRSADTPTHKGQVAFPGGGLKPGESATEAALREAQEEVGLEPGRVEILGGLDEFPTVTAGLMVRPIIGRLAQAPVLTLDPREVEHAFEVPIEALCRREDWIVRYFEREGVRYPVHYFDWQGDTLWGLSAWITLRVLHLMGVGPFEVGSPEVLMRGR